MEKIAFRNSRNKLLVGNLYKGNSKCVVIMAHGFANDKSSQGRFDKIAKALKKLEFNVLAFDFSGCGESEQDIISVKNEIDDLGSAILSMKSRGYEKIALFGYSLGSLICLRCFEEDIVTMVLLGALTHSMKYNWRNEFTVEQMSELERTGKFSIKSDLKVCYIGNQMLKDFEEIEQDKLLKNVKCPVLILHGDNKSDKEECKLLSNSRKGMNKLPKSSELIIIKGAKHDFIEHLSSVVEFTCEWYRKYLLNI